MQIQGVLILIRIFGRGQATFAALDFSLRKGFEMCYI